MRNRQNRGGLLLGITLLLCTGAASAEKDDQAQGRRTDINGIVETVDISEVRVIFQDRQAMLRVEKQKAEDAKKKPEDRPKNDEYEKYAYQALIVPQNAARIAARQIDYAWQKFQDTSRWAISTRVNGGLLDIPSILPVPIPMYQNYSTGCLAYPVGDIATQLGHNLFSIDYLDAGDNLKVDTGNPKSPQGWPTSEQGSYLTKDYKLPEKLEWKQVGDNVNLKSTMPIFQIPQVQHDTYCPQQASSYLTDNLLGFMPNDVYFPGIMTCTPIGCATDDKWPFPRKIDWNEVKNRQKAACDEVIKPAAKEYYKEIAKAVAHVPGGLVWSERVDDYVGLYTVPVQYIPKDLIGYAKAWLTPADKLKQQAEDKKDDLDIQTVNLMKQTITNTEDKDATNVLRDYYNQIITNPTGLPGTDIKQKGSSTKDQVGINKLEEVKRLFPVLDVRAQENMGFANLFQVWAKPEAVIDNKIQLFNFKALCIPILAACLPMNIPQPINDMIVTPAGCQVLPTRFGTTTYVMPRYHYRWVTVPEGYAIPDVNGTPVGLVSK